MERQGHEVFGEVEKRRMAMSSLWGMVRGMGRQRTIDTDQLNGVLLFRDEDAKVFYSSETSLRFWIKRSAFELRGVMPQQKGFGRLKTGCISLVNHQVMKL